MAGVDGPKIESDSMFKIGQVKVIGTSLTLWGFAPALIGNFASERCWLGPPGGTRKLAGHPKLLRSRKEVIGTSPTSVVLALTDANFV